MRKRKTTNLNTRVSEEQKARLLRVAGGNISKGVREALTLYFSVKDPPKAEALIAQNTSD